MQDWKPNRDKEPIDPERVKALSVLSDRLGFIQLAMHLIMLIMSGFAIWRLSDDGWLIIIALLIHGILISFLFAPLHETIHRTAFKSAKINDRVAFILGLIMLLPPDYFRAFHFVHHRWTHNLEKDPELQGPGIKSIRRYLVALSGWIYWSGNIQVLMRHAFGKVEEDYINDRLAPRVTRQARIYLALYAGLFAVSVIAGSSFLLWYWIVPALIGQPFLRVYLMSEHGGLEHDPDMLKNSRTITRNPFFCWLLWNLPHHSAHHLLPAVPFHALPQVTDALEDNGHTLPKGFWSTHRALFKAILRSD